ncbi:MAG TPA: c-type cytochrome [Anaerolineales bacterium]|nr:c-type cytochrome [Anaerolineales bacterium]
MDDQTEGRRRRAAIAIFGGLIVLFIVLSGFSFARERQRPTPDEYTFRGFNGVDGKRVFQAYNCMGCHTLLGNGAYFAPDLTKVYEEGGPAWIDAFLSSPGTWPTKRSFDMWLERMVQAGDIEPTSVEAYYEKYPHVLEALELLGGQRTVMPNLNFSADEISSLVAFFNYSAEIDTAGWPPPRLAPASLVEEVQARYGLRPPVVGEGAASPTPSGVGGEQLATQLGCRACHTLDGSAAVGPSWAGLYGSMVTLVDGTVLTVDDSYLSESILAPDAKIRQGFAPGIMPSFEGQLSQEELDALIAYLRQIPESGPGAGG